MYNMLNDNAKHGKFLCQFPSLLGSMNQLVLNGGSYLRSDTREPARAIREIGLTSILPPCMDYMDTFLFSIMHGVAIFKQTLLHVEICEDTKPTSIRAKNIL